MGAARGALVDDGGEVNIHNKTAPFQKLKLFTIQQRFVAAKNIEQ